MKAIILVAGQGTRLRPHTDEAPKCLVPFRGRPIIAHAVEALRAAGITDLTLVTGYRADRLERLGIRTRHNPRYATTNMVHSLFCAEDQMEGDDLLMVYGDIVFAPRIVAALAAAPAPLSVAVDRAWRPLWAFRMGDPLADAETLRLDPAGRIVELGKKPRTYEDIDGQYMGLVKIARNALPEVRRFYHELDPARRYDGKDLDNMYMTSFIQAVIDDLMPVQAVLVEGGWLEIDSVEDLDAYEQDPAWVEARLR